MLSALFAVLKTLLGPPDAVPVTTLTAAAGVHLLVLQWRSRTESEAG